MLTVGRLEANIVKSDRQKNKKRTKTTKKHNGRGLKPELMCFVCTIYTILIIRRCAAGAAMRFMELGQ